MVNRILAALLFLLAVPATALASSGLHDCGTSVQDRVGNGWCHGSGTFRLVVSCEDGRTARSPWISVAGGKGMLGVSCHSRATGAVIEKAPGNVRP
ncbi:hypothetical protein FHS29_002202 [Saccharothrix tamanrassetensis]|uniref:Uncharacterized protein n=1 Tax=Saccharothrix tamanrassetensis TaxID=1051531 RepID=A0A841CEB5_9PSEU|nr:hypothetical protein [Saccharothrix tamanrassetensis]MBB5955621.1 hypothetical protein [Saccharothrix tamanrassetensis]